MLAARYKCSDNEDGATRAPWHATCVVDSSRFSRYGSLDCLSTFLILLQKTVHLFIHLVEGCASHSF